MGQAHQGRFVQEGKSIDYTPGAKVTGGDVVVQNNLVGIAKLDIAANALGALAIGGIFDIVKKEEAFATVGANIFWDATGDPYNGTAGTGALTATAVGNTWCGFVLETAESTDETVRILLRSTVTLTAESFSLADLSDIDAVAYTAGLLLVGTGTKFADVALSGPFNLAASGLLSMDSATVAATGADQAGAAAIADGFTLVTAADAAKGVILPAAAAGGLCVVKNNGAAVLLLYPNTDDAIDALGANNAMSVSAYGTRILVAYDATTWYSTAIPDGAVEDSMLEARAQPLTTVIADPGDAGAIPVTNSGTCPLVTGGAETRTLADPTYAGQLLNLGFKTDGGDCTITSASPVNQTGNNTLLLEDVGDQIMLVAIEDGADIEWRVVCNDGVALSTV